MPEPDDQQLLGKFAADNSEAAFTALVARYVNLVYSTALRFTGNSHHAEEVTQAVFIILARKAGSLRRGTVLSGWLYQTARLTSANFTKGEIRRQRREQEAYMQSTTLNEPETAAWEQIAPLLDEAMGGLGETDRNAVVLRFFQSKTAREAGAALKLTEAAAHKRANRALEKLRKFFLKRGVNSTTAAIGETISANSIQAAPVALAKSVTAIALAKGAAAGGSTLTLVKGALKIMAWSKAKTLAIVAVAAIIGTSATTVAVKKLVLPKTGATAYPGDWIWEGYSESFDRVPPIFLLQPSTLPPKTAPYFYFGKDGYLARGQTLKELFKAIWSQKDSARKLIFTGDPPNDRYDFIVTHQPHWPDKLQSELNKRYRLVEKIETSEMGEAVIIIGASADAIAKWESAQPKPVAGAYPGDWIWETESLDAVPAIFLLRPSTMPDNYVPSGVFGKIDRYRARGQTVKDLITTIWSQKNSGMKLIFAADLPGDKYDFIAASEPDWPDKLESEINKRFNLVEQIESSETGQVVVVEKAP